LVIAHQFLESPNLTKSPFAGASAKYLGEREGELAKKRGDERKKELFTMHARLCGGGYLLKALGSVASYLADLLFNLSNDTHRILPLLFCLI
jgi:hypothetical protein